MDIIGDNDDHANTGSNTTAAFADVKSPTPYTAVDGDTVDTLNWRGGSITGSVTIHLAIYTLPGPTPVTLTVGPHDITVSNEGTHQWHSVTFPAESLTNGVRYCMLYGACTANYINRFLITAAGAIRGAPCELNAEFLPSPFPVGRQFSMYGTVIHAPARLAQDPCCAQLISV